MSKEKIEVGDWVRLSGENWAIDYPDEPEYFQVTHVGPDKWGTFVIDIHIEGRSRDVGDIYGLYGSPRKDGINMSRDRVEWVPESEVPDDIRFKDESAPGPSENVKGIASSQRLDELTELLTHDPVDPKHYQFPSGVEVRQISGYLTGFGSQALQYVARATRMDDGNKGDRIEDLRKSIKFIEWEIERLEAE